MSTLPRSPFRLSANFLGPIFSLNAELTRNAQNIVYARNGTGKSFLSRAFRYLDLHRQGRDIQAAAHYLVSDEASEGKGGFEFSRGSEIMGALNLEKLTNTASATDSNTIFHVFSEEFVQEELRQRSYEIDGQIDNQISVDSENIALQDVNDRLVAAREHELSLIRDLSLVFRCELQAELIERAKINKRLKEYRDIDFHKNILPLENKPPSLERPFTLIVDELNRLKELPSDPVLPEASRIVSIDHIDYHALTVSLNRITSLSTVADEIKQKIELHPSFYETGIALIQQDNMSTCPLCDQDISAHNPQTLIDAYISYFSDEEQKHKNELWQLHGLLVDLESDIENTVTHIAQKNPL